MLSLNRFCGGYVRNDPVNFVDPDGLRVADCMKPGRSCNVAGPSNWGYVGSAGSGLLLAAAIGELVDELNDRSNEDKNTIPWPDKNRGQWSCVCKAEKAGRRADNCSTDDKDRAYGWGIDKQRTEARRKAEKMAVQKLGAGSTHHVSCKCTGPKGERWNRGG